MKRVVIFAVFLLMGMGIVLGEHPEPLRRPHQSIIPLGSDDEDNPFSPNYVSRPNPLTNSFMQEARQAQQLNADPNGEFKTTANEPVVPGEYNGDVRNLPKVRATEMIELELREPASTRKRPAATKDAEAAENISNNISTDAMPSPSQSFAGMSFVDNCNGVPCGAGHPPDTNGDVGLNHYIEAVNYGIAIYNKTGTRLAAFTEGSLWKNAGTGTVCDSQAHGDPVVVYDQFADRWIISHFAFGFDSGGSPTTPFYECLAVSKTSDPVAGGWWFYPLRVDNGTSGQPPANTIGDYPKFGNWNDGCLYMSANEFSLPSWQYIGALFASINKADMYSGQPLTSSIGFIPNGGSPSSLLPSNISGAKSSDALPPAGTPNYFVSQSMDSFSWEVRKFTPGKSPKICGAGGTLSAPVKIPQTPFDSPNDVTQPNANALQSVGERLIQKAQYRKVGPIESLWMTHAVQANASSTVRLQWAQINVTGGTIRPTAVQQQIYAPDTTLNRWIPSIAADHDGNMAMGYSTSNASLFPSIAYAGRLASDPLNQLSQGEVQLVGGAGSQKNTCGGPCTRWGDYSAMSIDPADDCTFWYVNQYYSSQANGDSGNWQTRIGSFKFPQCGATTAARTLTVSSANPSSGVAITVSPDDNNDAANGASQFQRIYSNGVTVSLTAPGVAGGNNFQKWQRDGADFATTAATSVTMDGNHTMTAVYVTPTTRTLTIASANPGNGVSINVTPNDNSSQGGGTSQFTRTYNNNTVVNLTAPATAGGNNFQKWQRDGADVATTAATSVTMDGPHTMTAVYIAPAPVQIVVQTNPTGRSFTVDGTSYTSTQTFTWTPGSNHTIATSSPQSGATGTQYVWTNWSDSGAMSHTVSPNVATTYTANFTTQYLLTMNFGPGGIVRPTTGFYDSGQAVNISVSPAANFSFNGWTGTGTGSFTGIFKSATVTMNGPITEAAAFGSANTTLQFGAASYGANESDGSVTITVTRVGDLNSAPLVAYVTTDGTGKEGRDYVSSQGILTFAKGEASKTFKVLLIDNGFADSNRTVILNLVNVASAFLGDQISAVLTISDNDAGKPPANPVDTPRSFVQFNYYDFLARTPDAGGWDFWTNEITKCGSNTSCAEVARVNTSGAFFLSIEFQETGYLIERIYKVAYGDATGSSGTGGPHQLAVPVVRFADFIRDADLIQRNLVVLQPGWQELLENNKRVYTDLFVRTTRFTQAYNPDMSVTEFIDRVNKNAGNVLSASERQTAINRFGTNPVDSNNFTARANTLRQIAEDPDMVAAERNRAFVLMQYFGYLRRNPDDAPEASRDYSGYDFWLTKLNQAKGDYIAAELVKAFIASSEYRQRFGP
jgi:hypothetical protein